MSIEQSAEAANPYAAPVADLRASRQQEPERPGAYYAMSAKKLFVMSVLTVGFYDLCFWWRQWQARKQAGADVNVFARTMFSPLMFFEFRNTLTAELIARELPLHPRLASAPLVYISAHILDTVVARMSGANIGLFAVILSCAATLVSASCLFAVQQSANQLLEAEGYRGMVNQGASAKTYVVGLAGALLWILAFVGAQSSD